MQLAMFDKKLVNYDQLEPVYLDRGVFFGDGVYEVLRSYNGRIFALEDHMRRFAMSLSAIAIAGVDIKQIKSKVEKAYHTSGIANARIYFHITRGSGDRKHTFSEKSEPTFFLTVTELPDAESCKINGISVSTEPDLRWKRCDIKSLNLLANVMARNEAAKKGCDEAILVDQAGYITEGAGSSFFAVFGNSIQTAPLTANILDSVTRKYVIRAAEKIGIETIEESMPQQKPKNADELFIAVTTKGIVPIVRFNDVTIGDGKPGKITKQLISQFEVFTR